MNRRQFLTATAASLTAGAGAVHLAGQRLGFASGQAPQQRLGFPPLLDTRSSGRLALTAQSAETSFLGGASTRTAGFNQGYLGPTIVMRNGALATNVSNRLGEPVTVHWHGMLVPGEHDGSAHSQIGPGKSWAIDLHIAQPPNTAWYHSHAHAATARHVYFGLAGVIHLTDGRDGERGLPSRYGIDDLTLILQDRRFDDAGRMVYSPDSTDILNGFQGGRMLVNGQFNAVAAVPRGIVRLRLLNASNARFYTLHFSDGRPLHLIATDGGFLPAPADVTYLRLAPGERMEVLADFSSGSAPVLMSASGLPMRILQFAIDERERGRITRLPDVLDGVRFEAVPEDVPRRRFALNMGGSSSGEQKPHAGGHGGHGMPIGAAADGSVGAMMSDFGINGRPHDMRRIDFGVKQGTTERWFITGGAGVEHPFHVHGVHFRVIGVGGAAPRPEDSGWKDIVVTSGEAEILVRFDHKAPPEHPYMLHCHILEHEDSGMMGQFTVA